LRTRRQRAVGVDIVNDGEYGKSNFTNYVRERIEGFEIREHDGGREERLSIVARDSRWFRDYFEANPRPRSRIGVGFPVCVEELRYSERGWAELQADIANFTSALEQEGATWGSLPANTPGTVEHWLGNDFYKSDEEFLFAIADVLHEEYRAITEAGLLLQIDDPDLPDCWNCLPDMEVEDYLPYALLRTEALCHALRDIPRELVRLHVCWGSYHGPHYDDIPLIDIADLIFSVPVGSYSIEASNPRHEHEWRVFEEISLPEDTTLVPGVVGHYSDFIEHPDLIADRLVRYANLVGRENVIAGTDCGLGTRVGHPEVCWAKLEALAEGARRASEILW